LQGEVFVFCVVVGVDLAAAGGRQLVVEKLVETKTTTKNGALGEAKLPVAGPEEGRKILKLIGPVPWGYNRPRNGIFSSNQIRS
jgi:hypothetical protein